MNAICGFELKLLCSTTFFLILFSPWLDLILSVRINFHLFQENTANSWHVIYLRTVEYDHGELMRAKCGGTTKIG